MSIRKISPGGISLIEADDDKPKLARFVLRVPEEVMRELKKLSEEEKRSTNSQILYMLEKSLTFNSR